MQYLVRCECGRQLVVTEGVPRSMTCECGRVVPLPDPSKRIYINPAGDSVHDDHAEPPAHTFVAHVWRRLSQMNMGSWVTSTILWLNISVFALMILWGVHPMSPNTIDMIRWGANYGPLTLHGEYWRLLTCMFLHFGAIHLIFNMWALWTCGFIVEDLVGNTGYLILYFISGLIGSIASLFWSPLAVSAGASGAIFGVAGALFGIVYHRRHVLPAQVLQSMTRNAVIFIGGNVLIGLSVPSIGLSAHLGGLVAGFCCGMAMSPTISRASLAGRRLRNLVVAAAGALAIGIAFLVLPTPEIDFQMEFALAGNEKKAVDTFGDAMKRLQQEKITRAQFADILEREVIPQWRKLTARIDSMSNIPENQKSLYELYHTYFTARQRSWELLAAGIREDDPHKETLSEEQNELWQAALAKLNKRP